MALCAGLLPLDRTTLRVRADRRLRSGLRVDPPSDVADYVIVILIAFTPMLPLVDLQRGARRLVWPVDGSASTSLIRRVPLRRGRSAEVPRSIATCTLEALAEDGRRNFNAIWRHYRRSWPCRVSPSMTFRQLMRMDIGLIVARPASTAPTLRRRLFDFFRFWEAGPVAPWLPRATDYVWRLEAVIDATPVRTFLALVVGSGVQGRTTPRVTAGVPLVWLALIVLHHRRHLRGDRVRRQPRFAFPRSR